LSSWNTAQPETIENALFILEIRNVGGFHKGDKVPLMPGGDKDGLDFYFNALTAFSRLHIRL
jgi:hypothetical protein